MLQFCAIEFDLPQRSFKELSIEEVEAADLHHGDKIYWIHCTLQQKNVFERLSKKLALPQKAAQLATEPDVIPTMLDLDESLTLQTQCLLATELNEKKPIQFGNLVIHLTQHFCFTVISEPIPALDEFKENCKESMRFAKTPCFILFLMIDDIINDYAKILFNFDMLSDKMDLTVRGAHENIYEDIIKVKQDLMKIKRYIVALREILLRISDRKIFVVSHECRLSIGKLANHSHLVMHEIESIHDILNSLLSQIDNNLMQDMGKSMRVLTAFATLFMPLTFITGIYGMNFQFMPELGWKYGYPIVLFVLLLCAFLILFVFKKLKWFK